MNLNFKKLSLIGLLMVASGSEAGWWSSITDRISNNRTVTAVTVVALVAAGCYIYKIYNSAVPEAPTGAASSGSAVPTAAPEAQTAASPAASAASSGQASAAPLKEPVSAGASIAENAIEEAEYAKKIKEVETESLAAAASIRAEDAASSGQAPAAAPEAISVSDFKLLIALNKEDIPGEIISSNEDYSNNKLIIDSIYQINENNYLIVDKNSRNDQGYLRFFRKDTCACSLIMTGFRCGLSMKIAYNQQTGDLIVGCFDYTYGYLFKTYGWMIHGNPILKLKLEPAYMTKILTDAVPAPTSPVPTTGALAAAASAHSQEGVIAAAGAGTADNRFEELAVSTVISEDIIRIKSNDFIYRSGSSQYYKLDSNTFLVLGKIVGSRGGSNKLSFLSTVCAGGIKLNMPELDTVDQVLFNQSTGELIIKYKVKETDIIDTKRWNVANGNITEIFA